MKNETGSIRLGPKGPSQDKGRREREKKRKEKKTLSIMITPAHLFLLLLPGGVQETLPLPFLLRCHVSVPVGLHVVHPARSVCVCVCVSHVPSNAKSSMSHNFVTTLAPLQREKDLVRQSKERKKEREGTNGRESRRESRERFSPRSGREKRSIEDRYACTSSACTYVRSLR